MNVFFIGQMERNEDKEEAEDGLYVKKWKILTRQELQ